VGRASSATRTARDGWQPVDLTRADRVAAALAECRVIAERAGGASLHSDPEWLLGEADPTRRDQVRLLLFRDGPATGYATLLVKPRPLKFQVGEVTLFSRRLRTFSLSGEPVLADVPDAARATVIGSLLACLRDMIRPGDALALEGVPADGALDHLVAARSATRFSVVRLGQPFEHQLIDMPADWESYERQLGTRSRKSLRYSRKKLAERLDGRLVLRDFTTPDQVDAYLADAVRISQKTYQWNLLGLGLRDRDALRARLRFAASRGWLRCYILYGREAPLAFMLGLLQHGTYHYLDVGYDPDWAKWSVGSVLQVEVMRDLFALPTPPRGFDFSTGYGAHKARFANRSRREANYLLLPRGLRSALLLGGYRATETGSAALSRLLERYDLKVRLKKLVRGRAVGHAVGNGTAESEAS
jgi:CelD/BcsL family acetyltransferase involved in cellulose biosynthesis